MNFLFDTSTAFHAFTYQHGWPMLIIFLGMPLLIYGSKKKLNQDQQRWFGTLLATIPLVCVMGRMLMTYLDGTFTVQEELPLHLCRVMSFMFPFILFYKNRKWFGITYFFATVGTLQSLLTPELSFSFPHHSYLTYWLLHGILVFLPMYCVVVYNFKVTKKDLINAIITINIYSIATGIINYFLDSNYFYTSHKPETASLLDYFGPWPVYIIVVELIAILLFILAWLPFRYSSSLKEDQVKNL